MQSSKTLINKDFQVLKNSKIRVFGSESYYEVPFKYVGLTIECRYDPLDTSTLYLYENNTRICEVKIVDKVSNGKSKRTNNIDYSKVLNDDRDVREMEEV